MRYDNLYEFSYEKYLTKCIKLWDVTLICWGTKKVGM